MEISRRNFLMSGALVITAVTLEACGNPAESDNQIGPTPGKIQAASITDLVFAQHVAVTSLTTSGTQPLVYPAGYEAAFAIYSGLIRFNESLAFEGDLAEKWSVAADGVTWTFTLKQGVTFHDGTPFNADSVVTYFTRMIDKTFNVSAYSLWQPIESTTKVDDYTVTIKTRQPYGALLNTLAHGSGLIPSPMLAMQDSAAASLHPVGTGPYMLDTFEPGTKLVVKANPNYFGDKPVYDTITYSYVADSAGRVAALQAGQANIISAVPVAQARELSTTPGINIINVPGLQAFGIGMNQTNAILRDVNVRKALNLAVDVDAIVTALFRGYATPLTSPLAPNTNGYAKAGDNSYDPDQAKSLLAAAGLTAGGDGMLAKDGTPVTLRLRTPDGMYANDVLVAQAVQNQLKEVGIAVEIQKVDPSTFWNGIKVSKDAVDFDLVLFGFNPSHGSGALQLDSLYTSNPNDSAVAVWNFNWYSNSAVDEAIAAAKRTVDDAARNSLLAQASKQIWDDAPYIWLYVPNNVTAYDAKAATPVVLPVVFTLPSRTPAS